MKNEILIIIFLLFFLFPFNCTTQSNSKEIQALWQAKGYITVAKVGGDFKTIQEAVDFAPTGWTIKIHGGVYYESIAIYKKGIILEAFDPVKEPVILDGIDPSLLEKPLQFEKIEDNIWVADYSWPYPEISDYDYSNPNSKLKILAIYENGSLLRGYRGPFEKDCLEGKKLQLFPNQRLGLAGPYACKEQLLKPTSQNLDTRQSEIKRIDGKFYYDYKQKKIYLSPAVSSDPLKAVYEIPFRENLIYIKATNVKIKDLIFKNSLDYAIKAEEANGLAVYGCLFLNCHFALLLNNTNGCTIEGNVFSDLGFYQRYSAEEIRGTVYERNTFNWNEPEITAEEKFEEDELLLSRKIVLRNNLFQGFVFSFPPTTLEVVFEKNMVVSPVLNLFESGNNKVYSGKIEIKENVFLALAEEFAFPTKFKEKAQNFLS